MVISKPDLVKTHHAPILPSYGGILLVLIWELIRTILVLGRHQLSASTNAGITSLRSNEEKTDSVLA